jgi:uncharacterized membrane protein
MTFPLLVDNPHLSGLKAIKTSKTMMYGHKWKLFCLCCRFIGWFLLGIVTLGIGLLWVAPYFTASFAIFYEDIKAQEIMNAQVICQDCGTIGTPIEVIKGSFWIELILWLCFLIPGLIYSIWRRTKNSNICSKCKSTSIIPTESPRGRKLMEEYAIKEKPL